MINYNIFCFAFLLLAVLSPLTTQGSGVTKTPQAVQNADNVVLTSNTRQQWIKIEQDLKKGVSKIIRDIMPVVMKEVYRKELSATCLGALMTFSKGLREAKLWAYQMIDASGRLPEGFLSGALSSLGNYEECFGININKTKVKVQGQYCTVNILLPMPEWKPFSSAHLTMPELFNISAPDSLLTYVMGFIHNLHIHTFKVGICTPSKCTQEDVNKLVGIIPEQLGIPLRFEVSRCEVKKAVEFTDIQIVVLYTMGVLVFIVLMGTIVDILYSSEEMENSSLKSTLFHMLKSFSLTTNAKKLSDFTCPDSELSFAYGIAFSVLCWNVIANTFMYANYDVISNFLEGLRLLQDPFFEIALNRIMPLQSIFFLCGFITTYKCVKSGKPLNIVKFLLSKFWRYTPTYALLVAFLLLTPTWGSGPSWYSHMNPVYNRCKENWWYNILYINNFLRADEQCLDHTWVFAVAAQLHVIAAFILVPLTVYPKIGLIVNFSIIVASLASVALTNVYYNLPPNEMSAIVHPKDRNFFAEHAYFRVYTHLSFYCSGVFVGYFLAKNRNFKLSKKVSGLLWLVTVTALLAAMFVVHEWRKGYMPNPLIAALYATFSKVAGAVFLAWFTVACMVGRSVGLVNVLGWRPLVFLGKLTFIAYIIHVPVLNMIMNFKKAPLFASELEILYLVLSHICGTYLLSYLLYMFFEAPWLSLSDVLSRRYKRRTFNSDVAPIREESVKYSEKPHITTMKCVYTLEKV